MYVERNSCKKLQYTIAGKKVLIYPGAVGHPSHF